MSKGCRQPKQKFGFNGGGALAESDVHGLGTTRFPKGQAERNKLRAEGGNIDAANFGSLTRRD